MRSLGATIGVAGTILALCAAPGEAEARIFHHGHAVRHYASRDACIRHKANKGTAIGAGAGAVVGFVAGGPIGGKIGGTAIGAGAGAVVGHQIAKHAARRSC